MLLPRAGGDWELCAKDHRSNYLINNYWFVRKPRRVFRLLTSDFQLQTSDFRLPTSDFRLPTSDFLLLTSDFRLKISYFKPQADLTKCKDRISDFWPLRLKAEWLDLRTSHFPLPTSDFRLPISHFWFPTSDFWLDSSVWLDRRSIHHAGSNAQSQSSVERMAVPFSPQKGTFKLALEKATKHKANPATNKIRLENRNLGLAWSQSGNNKTVQTLLTLF